MSEWTNNFYFYNSCTYSWNNYFEDIKKFLRNNDKNGIYAKLWKKATLIHDNDLGMQFVNHTVNQAVEEVTPEDINDIF